MIIVHFQLRSFIHAGLIKRSLYNRFALKNLQKWGFGGITGGGAKPCVPCTPLAEIFCTTGEYVIISNGVFNFNFLALLFSEILAGPKFTLGVPTPPGRPLAEKFLYPKRVLYNM